jgi:two-component system CheB/CheR fusion protein
MTEKKQDTPPPEISNDKVLLDPECEDVLSDAEILSGISQEDENAIDQIIGHLFSITGMDFSHYRKTTVFRRIVRRVAISKSESINKYFHFLTNTPEEMADLYNDLLLSYTEFFREPFVFAALKEKVFPSLIEQRSSKDTIRIWVPGCSTGEEVYSIAICFQEFLQECHSNVNIKAQFFGTDLNPRHIVTARAALYPEKIRKNLSTERIEQFFDQTEEGLKVTKHIREMCVFAVQNIIQDPPFSNIDMVSCRNVLIYFDNSFQDIAIPLFHFSLRNDGFLLLGSSESMGRFQELFSNVDQKINLFSKRRSRIKSMYRFPVPVFSGKGNEESDKSQQGAKQNASKVDINKQIDTLLLESYTPPCILVDSNLMLRQTRGHVFPFIQPIAGDASLKLSKMVGDNLMPELYVAIEEARKKKCTIKKSGVQFKHAESINSINIIVTPVNDTSRKELCYLIVFESNSNTGSPEIVSVNSGSSDEELGRLRDELRATKEHLQSIIEEKDEVNQELWASNEEVQSTNEELQSVNEEMEAAKEELESSNEELLSLNEELRQKNGELSVAKYFSDNIIETARTIFITTDNKLLINTVNSFTEQISEYQREEIIGKNCFVAFFHDRVETQTLNLLNEIITGKIDACQFEGTMVTRSGKDKTISWRCSALKDINNHRSGVLLIGIDITRQKIAESSLIESENKYRNLVESSQDFIWQCNAEGKYTYLNPASKDIFGFQISEMLGRKITEFESPDSPDSIKKMMERLFSGEIVHGYEALHLHKSGMNIHLIINAQPELSEDHKVLSIRGVAHNITNLRIAEYKYKTLFTEMLDGFALHEIICDSDNKPVDYRFLSVNPAFEKQTGLKAEDLIGKTVREILPQVEQSWIDKYGEVALTGKPMFFENFSSDLNKHFTVRAYRPSQGQFACIFSDVTEQKNSENKIKDILERFDQLSLQTRTFLWEINTDGLLTFVSSSVESIAGYTPDEIVGKFHFYDFSSEEVREKLKVSCMRMMKERQPISDIQNLIHAKDNRQMWVSVHAAPYYDSKGTFIGFRGGNTDITERKNNELMQQRLEQQQQQTQRLESLGVLAGGIAHDFNNLLGGIFGFIDLAIDECKNTRGVQYLSTALTTIERARSLTQQLLTFAKGGSPIQSIGALFPFVQDTVKFVLSGSNINCRFDIDPDLKTCSFDKNQLGQVFDNLIINAMQAMPMGGTIYVTAKNVFLPKNYHTSLKEGDYVKISVTDTGIGISPELISRIFDPFFTTKMKGHGLGLATCYSIINRHNGHIDVESIPGKGSTFHIFLPVCNEPVPESKIELPAKHTGNGIFLVMDDEEVIRMTMDTMLSLFGYKVVCKENGEDTLKFFKDTLKNNESIAGIILDLTVPGGLGGKEVIEEIRTIDTKVPVFVSSGYADDPVMSNPAKFGFTGSLCKPFRVADLTRLLSQHINTDANNA